MELGKQLSLSKKIKSAPISKMLPEVINEWDAIPKNLIDEIYMRLVEADTNDIFIIGQSELFTKLIIQTKRTRDARFYLLLEERRLFPDKVDSLIQLLMHGINTEMVEQALLRHLESTLNDETFNRAPEILRSLEEQGSIDCLAELVRIEYDHRERFKIALDLVRAPRSWDSDEARAKTTEAKVAELTAVPTGEALKAAIKGVEARDKPRDEDWLISTDRGNAILGKVMVPKADLPDKIWPLPADEAVHKDEGQYLEFKTSLRGLVGRTDKDYFVENTPQWRVIKAIAGLANAEGGQVIIGVDDSINENNCRKIIGIEEDYDVVGGNKDQYGIYLQQLIKRRVPATANNVNITFADVSSKTICLITIEPSDVPVWMNWKQNKGSGILQALFNRTNAYTERLNDEEAEKYIAKRFPRN